MVIILILERILLNGLLISKEGLALPVIVSCEKIVCLSFIIYLYLFQALLSIRLDLNATYPLADGILVTLFLLLFAG